MTSLLIIREAVDRHPILFSIVRFFRNSDRPIDPLVITRVDGIKALLFKVNKPRQFLIFSDPLVLLIFALAKPHWIIRRKIRLRIVFFSLEMFEYQRPEFPFINRLKNQIFKIAHTFALKVSGTVVFPNQHRLNFYKQNRYLPDTAVTHVIPNVPSAEKKMDYVRLAKTSISELSPFFVSQLGQAVTTELLSHVWFIYSGSLSQERGIDTITNAFESQNRFKLMVLGDDKSNYFSKPFKNVRYIGHVNPKQVAYYYRISFGGMLHYDNTVLNSRLCAPVKLFEYLENGLIIIGNKNDGLAELLPLNMMYSNETDLVDILNRIDMDAHNVTQAFPSYEELLYPVFNSL